jgi:hypothetical protein
VPDLLQLGIDRVLAEDEAHHPLVDAQAATEVGDGRR